MAIAQGAFKAIVNVKWTGGTWIVVKARRRGLSHGNGVPGVPDFNAVGMMWHPATAVQPVSLNNPFFRDGIPDQFQPKPDPNTGKFDSLPAFRALTAWGGYEVQETAGGGPQLLRAMDFSTFAEGGYQDGQWVQTLGFWNVNAIKKFPPYGPGPDGEGNLPANYTPPAQQEIKWTLSINQLVAVDEPEPPGPQPFYYVWGHQLEFHPGFPPISGDITFADQQSPTYYLSDFKIGEINGNDINIPRHQAFLWYFTNQWGPGQGTPEPPVKWPAPIPSAAAAQAVVDWATTYANANPTGNSGATLDARQGTIPGGASGPPITQPEAYLEFTVQLYSGAAEFKYTPDNTPMWTKQPEKEFSFTWGGSAPQLSASWEITYNAKATERLKVQRIV